MDLLFDVWARALAHVCAQDARAPKPWRPKECDVCGQQIERAPGARGPHPSKHRNCSLLLARLGQVERTTDAVDFLPQGRTQARAHLAQLAAAILAAPVLDKPAPTRAPHPPRRPTSPPPSPACNVCGRPTPSRRAKACGPACASWVHRVGEAARLAPHTFGHVQAQRALLARVLALADKCDPPTP